MFKLSFQESVIGRRFILYTLVFSSIVALVFTLVQVQRESLREEQKYTHFEEIIEHSLLDSLGNSIWAYDDSQIYSQLQGVKNLPSVQRVHLALPDDVQFNVGQITADYIKSKDFPVFYANHGVTQSMGMMTVYTSMDERYLYLFEYAMLILVTNLSKTLFVVIFMFFLFDFLVSRHLLHIAKELMHYNQSEKPVRIQLKRKKHENSDELDSLVDSINTLQQRVFFEQCKFNNQLSQKELLHEQIIEQKEQLMDLERNIGLNEFALGLRVEIRKPLFGLRTSCEKLHHDANMIPYNRLAVNSGLEEMSGFINRALEVIDQSNDLFKYKQPSCSSVDINVSIAKMLDLLSHNFQAEGICVKHPTASQSVLAYVDEKHIEQVLISVVKNGLESLTQSEQENKNIEINAFAIEDRVEIHVEDNGPGVEEHLLEKIFVPYYTTKETGLGIGLSISRSLLLEMEGSIVASNNTSGFSIVITLPACGLDGALN